MEQSVLDTLKSKVDLVQYIGKFTKLRKTGSVYQGTCVLHPDSDTPSLTVYPDNQSYYCFGCKSGGSIVDFVRAYYNYDFHEAMGHLAEQTGLDLQAEDTPQAKARRRRIEQNARLVLENQKKLMATAKAADYLHRRGFSEETIKAFNLGFDLEDNSIVIPFNDGFGKPIGISKRFFEPGTGPKYKNSRNDEVFNKGLVLYNFDKARRHAKQKLYVLEGYFDVLSLHQSGFPNSVGICKDTLTEDQARLICKLCKGLTVVLVPDNDETGRKSILKNRELLRTFDPDLHIQVAMPPEDCKDMNDCLLRHGEQGVRAVLEAAESADIYAVRLLLTTETIQERQYQVIRDYLKTVKNKLVIEDILRLLTREWDKKETVIRDYLELGGGGGRGNFWFPHDRVLERKLIGAILSVPKYLDMVADKIVGEAFYIIENRVVYEAMLRVYEKLGTLTQTDLYLELKGRNPALEPGEIFDQFSLAHLPETEILAIKDSLLNLYYHRKLLQAALEVAETISGSKCDDFDEIQAKAQDMVFKATDISQTTPVHRINDLLADRWEEYLKRSQGHSSRGLLTGFFAVDQIISGFKPKHLIVLAASTSTGKTALALNLVRNLLKRENPVPVGIISLEMSAQEIMDRIIVAELKIDGQRYERGDLKTEELDRFSKRLNALYNKPLLISDERGLTISQIRARLRRMKAEMGGLGFVVVDYLQTIQLETAANVTTARATGDVVLQLRNLASELDVPILMLSQINRSYSQRQDKRPQVSDLRESGNIEEFADMVLFLYRHSRTSPAAYEECKALGTENDVEVIVAKNRTGRTGITKLYFDDQHMRFSDPHSDSYEAQAPGPVPFDE